MLQGGRQLVREYTGSSEVLESASFDTYDERPPVGSAC